MRKLAGTMVVRYPPIEETSVSNWKTVGPTMSRKASREMASTMFKLLSHWIPRCTPETADRTKARVSTAMIATATPFDDSTPHRKSRPLLICSAPRPSDVALPNSVAKIARMSIDLPIGPFTRSPISG